LGQCLPLPLLPVRSLLMSGVIGTTCNECRRGRRSWRPRHCSGFRISSYFSDFRSAFTNSERTSIGGHTDRRPIAGCWNGDLVKICGLGKR
jgi:hypothetical protein